MGDFKRKAYVVVFELSSFASSSECFTDLCLEDQLTKAIQKGCARLILNIDFLPGADQVCLIELFGPLMSPYLFGKVLRLAGKKNYEPWDRFVLADYVDYILCRLPMTAIWTVEK